MKVCKRCGETYSISMFYFLGYIKKTDGKPAFSSYCRPCNSLRVSGGTKKFNKPYKPQKPKLEYIEDLNPDLRTIYILLKKIDINGCIGSIDAFRLVDQYILIYGNDIPDFYTESEQVDIMYNKLKKYMTNH